MDDKKKDAWETSFLNRQNFVFYPNEEVIRFFARRVRKQIGLDEFENVHDWERTPRCLDLGCGIGRHVMFAARMGLDAHGVDLSHEAIRVARDWATREGIDHVTERLVQGDIRALPWRDGFFDVVVSHGVLDSMHFDIAKAAVREVSRVLDDGGLFYCDLISGDDSTHFREYNGEVEVADHHERGTIQSYFNYEKVVRLLGGSFTIEEVVLVRRETLTARGYGGRFHVVARKPAS